MKIRKKIGRWKGVLVDRWPYWWMVRRSGKMRARLAPETARLTPIIAKEEGPGEIHMLCGKEHADMAMWSTWSFLRFLPHLKLYVHSDGTLDESTQSEWSRIVPDVTFVDKKAAQEVLERKYPNGLALLKEWRRQHIYSAKLVDFHLFGDSEKIMLLDSDILCLQQPSELIDAMCKPVKICTWNEDEKNNYPTDLHSLRQITGVDVPPRFNAGLVVMRRLHAEDFGFVEDLLTAFRVNGLDVCHHWAEQAIVAALSTRHYQRKALSSGYSVTKGKTTPNTIVRHYVGTPSIRPRFYLEGVPMLIQQLQANGARSI